MRTAILLALACAWSSAAVAQPRVLSPSEVRGDPVNWVPDRITDTYPGQRVDLVCQIYRPDGLNEAGKPRSPRFTGCKVVGEAAALADIDRLARQFERFAYPKPTLAPGEVMFKMQITPE